MSKHILIDSNNKIFTLEREINLENFIYLKTVFIPLFQLKIQQQKLREPSWFFLNVEKKVDTHGTYGFQKVSVPLKRFN